MWSTCRATLRATPVGILSVNSVAACGLSRATAAQLGRDAATLAAVGLAGLGALTLHATTVFGFGAEAQLRGELTRDSLLLAGAAVAAIAPLRVGGAEWRDGTAAPLLATPLSRAGWFLGRLAGVLAVAALAVGVVAVAAAATEGLARGTLAGAAGLLAVAALAAGACWGAARPGARGARWCGLGGAVLGGAAVLATGGGLLPALAGALAASAVLAVAAAAASVWLPPGGALGATAAVYLLGHTVQPGWSLAGRAAWRLAVPDLAGCAAVEPAALAAAAVWAGGIAWLGVERTRRWEG